VRVLLDTTYSLRGPTGTGVYVRQLAAALRGLGVEVVEAANAQRNQPGGGWRSSVGNLLADTRWTNRELRRLAADVDVIHHPLPAHARGAAPQVVTVHDLAFLQAPELFARSYRVWAARAHRASARRADVVICPSEATRNELRKRWGIDAIVAHHGPGQAGAPLQRAAPRHFLYVGDDEPRKDLATLRAAHAALGPQAPPLVLTGSAGERVSAERLRELHSQAIALVHPSRIEGFGLTVLEAMALGTPVIAARSAAVQEVAGDTARYFEAGDVAALTELMSTVDGTLGAAGQARAAAFSWEASARIHIEAYTLASRR
jgi:glycosyltransferase involved in cell wall biosynthesis